MEMRLVEQVRLMRRVKLGLVMHNSGSQPHLGEESFYLLRNLKGKPSELNS